MKKKTSILIAGLLVALMVAGVIGATSAFAQSATPSVLMHGRGPGGGRGLGEAELAAAAEALNTTTAELTAALQAGTTLEQLAKEAGVDLQDVRDAIQAVRETELRARTEQAVADGTMMDQALVSVLARKDPDTMEPGLPQALQPLNRLSPAADKSHRKE